MPGEDDCCPMEAIAMMFRHEEYTDEPILTLTYVKAIAK